MPIPTVFSREEATVDAASINRILVIKWSAMGDLAMAGAAFEDIANAFPNASVDLDTLPPWDTLYRDDARFRQVHCFNLRKGGPRESWRWLKTIAKYDYDLVIDLQTTDRSRSLLGLLCLLHKSIPYRAGNKDVWPYNLRLQDRQKENSPRHALQIARDTLAAAGITGTTPHPHLHITQAIRESAAALMPLAI